MTHRGAASVAGPTAARRCDEHDAVTFETSGESSTGLAGALNCCDQTGLGTSTRE